MSSLPNFFYSDRILQYSFGPKHPLKPERLRRTVELLERFGVMPIDPGQGRSKDVLRVHSESYVETVQEIGEQEAEYARIGRRQEDARFGPKTSGMSEEEKEKRFLSGFGSMDNPPFPNMHEVSLDYVSSVVRAAEAVRDGDLLSFGIGGGLHHAQRSRASGFCIYNDPAIACAVLREKFERVAYIDIDLHHGDGVQALFWDEPSVLTCSIHESGRSLYPGTGFEYEVSDGSSFNVPLAAQTTGDIWLWAFENSVLPALHCFQPQALVVQCGCDPHFNDPLGHLNCRTQDWLGAVTHLKNLDLPTVVVGGGGYELTNVPRMWAAACLTFGGIEFDDQVPGDLATAWQMPTFSDHDYDRMNQGVEEAERVIQWLQDHHPLLVR